MLVDQNITYHMLMSHPKAAISEFGSSPCETSAVAQIEMTKHLGSQITCLGEIENPDQPESIHYRTIIHPKFILELWKAASFP